MAEIIFKDLTVDNLFDFCGVLDVVGVEDILNVFDKKEINALQKANESTEKIGIVVVMKLVKLIIKNIPKAKNEICEFLAGCTEFDDGTKTSAKDLIEMKIVPFVKLIKEFSKREDLTDFFGEVAELWGSERKNLKNSSTEDTEGTTDISTEQ